jgi:hypothetical protein
MGANGSEEKVGGRDMGERETVSGGLGRMRQRNLPADVGGLEESKSLSQGNFGSGRLQESSPDPCEGWMDR